MDTVHSDKQKPNSRFGRNLLIVSVALLLMDAVFFLSAVFYFNNKNLYPQIITVIGYGLAFAFLIAICLQFLMPFICVYGLLFKNGKKFSVLAFIITSLFLVWFTERIGPALAGV